MAKKDGYDELLKRRRNEYKSFVSVYCPALKDIVHFNSDGFNHLRFHTDGTPRNPAEQMYKMGLLPLVIPVIKTAVVVDQYEKRVAPIGRKKKNAKKVVKEIEYWGITATVGRQNVKLKVVLRKISGSDKVFFWSVMKFSEAKEKRKT